jgi:hypothetical protein
MPKSPNTNGAGAHGVAALGRSGAGNAARAFWHISKLQKWASILNLDIQSGPLVNRQARPHFASSFFGSGLPRLRRITSSSVAPPDVTSF